MLSLGCFLYPVSYHSFIIKAASRLFFANEKKDSFDKKGNEATKQFGFDPHDLNIIRQHE